MLTRHPDHLNGVPTHVLVVDDDKTIRRYVATVLERAQYRVSTAPDAETALELIEADAPDLVILDQELPDVSGEELLRFWRASGMPQDFPVIFFSNDTSAERFRAVMNMGADDYLVKPIKPRELSDAVAVQLNKFRQRQGARNARLALKTAPSPALSAALAASAASSASSAASAVPQASLSATAARAAVPKAVRYEGVPPGYEVWGTLAKGGSATAYRARRSEDGAECVIKVIQLHDDLDDALLARFTREGEVLQRITHPGVVRAYAHGVIEAGGADAASGTSFAYLALEYVAGGTLRTMLGRPWEPKAALRLLAQVAEGLAAVHAAGVIHRDIKPDNILLRANSLTPVLVDFGTAKDLVEERTHTRKGVILGTPSYMAPELITGGEPTPATDLYACGALLYELLTGSKPYSGENVRDLLRRHLDFPVPRLPTASASLQPLIDSLLAKRAGERPRDGAALATMLREHLPPPTVTSRVLPDIYLSESTDFSGYPGQAVPHAPELEEQGAAPQFVARLPGEPAPPDLADALATALADPSARPDIYLSESTDFSGYPGYNPPPPPDLEAESGDQPAAPKFAGTLAGPARAGAPLPAPEFVAELPGRLAEKLAEAELAAALADPSARPDIYLSESTDFSGYPGYNPPPAPEVEPELPDPVFSRPAVSKPESIK